MADYLLSVMCTHTPKHRNTSARTHTQHFFDGIVNGSVKETYHTMAPTYAHKTNNNGKMSLHNEVRANVCMANLHDAIISSHHGGRICLDYIYRYALRIVQNYFRNNSIWANQSPGHAKTVQEINFISVVCSKIIYLFRMIRCLCMLQISTSAGLCVCACMSNTSAFLPVSVYVYGTEARRWGKISFRHCGPKTDAQQRQIDISSELCTHSQY